MKKNVLITGGAGSLGSAVCKELLKDNAINKIVIYSRNEKSQLELKWQINDPRVHFIISDIRDYNSMYNATIDIDEVYHLAALKHIDIAEENPAETTTVNVLGTMNVINASIQNKVKKVLLISTDKASSPTGIYGTTKLLAEKTMLLSNGISDTKFSVARFGNLIGSNGSIFQKWSKDKKISLTDKDMTRFFIKMDDAAEYCIEFMNILEGNEIFMPKMKSAKIYDIALSISDDIEVIGLRKNEKVHEDAISNIDFGNILENERYYKIIPDGSQNQITYNSKDNTLWFTNDEIKEFYI